MEESSDGRISADLATRIEKTLTEREQERLSELPAELEVPARNPLPGGISYFSYRIILLGLFVCLLIGVALYFLKSVPGSVDEAGRSQVESPKGLSEADTLLLAGKYSLARKAYEVVISQYPDSPRAYNNLASLYATEGDLERARTLLNKALATNPDYLVIYRNLSTIYTSMARDSYEKALQLESVKTHVRLQILGQKQVATVIAQAEKSASPVSSVATDKAGPQMVVAQQVSSPVVGPKYLAKAKPSAMPDKVLIHDQKLTPLSSRVTQKSGEAVVSHPVVDLTKVAIDTPSKVMPKAVVLPPAKEKQKKLLAGVKEVSAPVLSSVSATTAQGLLISAVSDPASPLPPKKFLQQWAKSWSSQQATAYLAFYAQDFVPPHNQSRKAWQKKRRLRLKKPKFIEVKLGPIESVHITDRIAKVQLVQTYRSDRYHDRTRKSFTLRRKGQSWVIVEERSMGRIR